MRTRVLGVALWVLGSGCVASSPPKEVSSTDGAAGVSAREAATLPPAPTASQAPTSGPVAASPPADPLGDTCDPLPPQSRNPNAELVNYGRWFVTNATAAPIVLRTDPSVQLLVTQIAPGETRAIKSVSEGSGGHVRPSNFIHTFSVESGGKTIYEGVRNLDWEDAGALCGHERYVLVVR